MIFPFLNFLDWPNEKPVTLDHSCQFLSFFFFFEEGGEISLVFNVLKSWEHFISYYIGS